MHPDWAGNNCRLIGLVQKMRAECLEGENAAGLGWWKKCGWIWLVAEMQVDWDGGRNAAGLG
jgi:hypothetical protein